MSGAIRVLIYFCLDIKSEHDPYGIDGDSVLSFFTRLYTLGVYSYLINLIKKPCDLSIIGSGTLELTQKVGSLWSITICFLLPIFLI